MCWELPRAKLPTSHWLLPLCRILATYSAPPLDSSDSKTRFAPRHYNIPADEITKSSTCKNVGGEVCLLGKA